MKPLLALLLFVSLAAGQTQTELKKEWERNRAKSSMSPAFTSDSYVFFSSQSDDKVIRCIVGSDTVYSKTEGPFQLVVIATLLRQWDAYAKECWADSTLTEGAMFRDFETGKLYWMEYHPKPWISNPNLRWLEFLKRRSK
jgi:hypothetical protein